MKRILFIEDDPLLVEMCRPRLERACLGVDVAKDGLAAMRRLKQSKPDLVVLDLMVPQANGLAVLMHIRSDEVLKGLPVLLLHNACLSSLVAQAILVGANTALYRDQRIPARLPQVIHRLLGGPMTEENLQPPDKGSEETSDTNRSDSTASDSERQLLEQTRASFLSQAPAVAAKLREFWSSCASNASIPGGWGNLIHLYQQVHSVSLHASLAGCSRVALQASILEALLFELVAKPGVVGPSLLRTLNEGTVCLGRLLEALAGAGMDAPSPFRVLVVDENGRRNDFVVTALRRVGLQAFGTKDPDRALQMLFAERYDVVPLDISMPGPDASEPGERLGHESHRESPLSSTATDGQYQEGVPRASGGGRDFAAQTLSPLEVGLRTVTLYFDAKLQAGGEALGTSRPHAADFLEQGSAAGPVLVWIEPFKGGGNGEGLYKETLAPSQNEEMAAVVAQ